MRAAQEGPLEGATTVDIAAARGETESFQVVVTAVGGRLEGVTASIESLRGAGGQAISLSGAVQGLAAAASLKRFWNPSSEASTL